MHNCTKSQLCKIIKKELKCIKIVNKQNCAKFDENIFDNLNTHFYYLFDYEKGDLPEMDREKPVWVLSSHSHSDHYKSYYRANYRLVDKKYLPYLDAIRAIEGLKKPAVVAIDGRCGSGKSSLAAVIKEVFSCNVFHMDDYYLPPHRSADDWETTPAGNMDLERFKEEVLQPVKEGKDVLYQPFDCQTGSLAEPSAVPPTQLTVIEGSYSQHPMLADQYDLKIFITSGPEVQRKRLTEREGDYVQVFFSRWMPLEERYFTAFDIENKSDMILDTSRFW
mgnify:CR=1 FL=1